MQKAYRCTTERAEQRYRSFIMTKSEDGRVAYLREMPENGTSWNAVQILDQAEYEELSRPDQTNATPTQDGRWKRPG